MKIKFTAQKIKSLKRGTKSIEYFDTGRDHGQGALGLRVSPKGKRVWFIMYPGISGKVKRFTLGNYPDMTLQQARIKANSVIADVGKGNDPHQQKVDYKASDSFSDVWELYIRSKVFLNKADSTRAEEFHKYNNHLKGNIGHMKINSIMWKDLLPILRKLAKTAPVNANRLQALLSVIFSFALDDTLIDFHPTLGRKPVGGKEKERDRYLKKDEIKKLWNAVDGLPGDSLKIILLTAARPGEVMGMEKDEIDIKQKTWTIPRSKVKTDKEHIVPLSEQAIKIIEPLMPGDSDFVFSSYGKKGHLTNISRYRAKIQKQINLKKNWTSHDLRRTAATVMGEIGIRPDIVERVLNHSPGKTARTYNLYSFLNEKRDALDELGKEIDLITMNDEFKRAVGAGEVTDMMLDDNGNPVSAWEHERGQEDD